MKDTNQLLDEIEERVNNAAAGPWVIDDKSIPQAIGIRPKGQGYLIASLCRIGMLWREGKQDIRTNADFIASARTDVPALVRALRESRILYLREVGPDSWEHKNFDRKIAAILNQK